MTKHQNKIGQLIYSDIFRQRELLKAIDEIVADIEGK